ncbi:conserved protein of unknown function [Tepidanaerobacter acetatoxydans Re1]|uniref:Uncharacterized protein n=2 Tax=Tepidanaerobacter acetatoxydans TaxID=499229 RepID=L0S4H6_TEPAE|nr:hypothetical protein [Tepidanaerobacter acetatoxydans]CCP27354.1 conserved protein of unknown function [Tepidanaerobacter acetatoxydans Re1]
MFHLLRYLYDVNEKNLNKLSNDNKFANNYEQYMGQIQKYHYDDNIEYARIFSNTKEELIAEAKKYVKELNYFDKEFGNEDELSEYEMVLQETDISFIGQGYYDIYLFCGELGVYRIDAMLRSTLEAEMTRISSIEEIWEYICGRLDEDED